MCGQTFPTANSCGEMIRMRPWLEGMRATYEWLMEETKGGALAREGNTAVVPCRHYSQENWIILVKVA